MAHPWGALCTATPKELNNALEPAAIFEQAYMVAGDRAPRPCAAKQILYEIPAETHEHPLMSSRAAQSSAAPAVRRLGGQDLTAVNAVLAEKCCFFSFVRMADRRVH